MSCKQKNSYMMMEPPIVLTHQASCGSSAMQQASRVIDRPKFGIVLLQGLLADQNELAHLEENLQTRYSHQAHIIRVAWKKRSYSLTTGIADQAKVLFQRIQEALQDEIKRCPLIIIGYSCGGVLACMLGDAYSSQLNICGIITINAPLMGVPVLERSHHDVSKFIAESTSTLQWINANQSAFQMKCQLHLSAFTCKLIRHKWMQWLPGVNGLKDILPKSSCMQTIRHFLREKNHQIPCRLIASEGSDFRSLFNLFSCENQVQIENLNKAYATFITGQSDEAHDTLIPVASQLCRGRSLCDLNKIDYTNLSYNEMSRRSPIMMSMPDQPHIEGMLYPDMSHTGNFPIINANLFHEMESVIGSATVFADICSFIEDKIEMHIAQQ